MTRRDNGHRRNTARFFNAARNLRPQLAKSPITNNLVAKKFLRHRQNAPEPALAFFIGSRNRDGPAQTP
jgi:hypothetical protein